MALDADEDILNDFLVEAGELLEVLSEQLVDLEKAPGDKNLLNAIFRGFHTVKGGAGFLGLTNLVEVCHGAENVFDELRNGKLAVNADLMDVVLQALDTVNAMFAQVQARQSPDAAPPQLLHQLEALARGESIASHHVEPAPAPAAPVASVRPAPPVSAPSDGTAGSDEITDDEFEALLDELAAAKSTPIKPPVAKAPTMAAPPRAEPPVPPPPPSIAGGSDEISDEVFEALLDQMHGKGQGPAATKATTKAATAAVAVPPPSAVGGGDELISDHEFEALLDELHGRGRAPSVKGAAKPKAPAAAPPAPVARAVTPPPVAPVAAPRPAVNPPPAARAPSPAPAAAQADAEASKAAAQAAAQAATQAQQDTTVRVDTKRLDDIMNMVGELVLVRNRLLTLSDSSKDEELAKVIGNLDVVTADLQGAVMKTRMQPIKKVFGRFPRVVRDLARHLKKDINLELKGEETDLDKNLVEALADPLVHLVRNAVDHGIEKPADREAAGKARTGTVTLAAAQEGDHILLTITDDGKGMDHELLRMKAVQKGLMDQDAAARLSPQECFNLIFAPGFSTAEQISDISGRGVGMDVVKTKITQLNGTIHVDSQKGKGSVITIKVPLTLAILPTLMVTVGKQTFALPLASVNEIFNLDLTKTNVVDGQLTVVIRKRAIPLFYLEDWLVKPSQREGRRKRGHVVIVQVGTQLVGFVVNSLLGQEEVVIKPLGPPLHGTPGMAGATITSDGGIALIVDVPGLLKHYARKF